MRKEKVAGAIKSRMAFLVSAFSFLLSNIMLIFARNLTKHYPYMAQNPSIPKGPRDFGFVEMAKRNYIFNTIREVYALYGFRQIETPAMENLSTLMGK